MVNQSRIRADSLRVRIAETEHEVARLRMVNEIVLGKRGITADTALRLAKFFGTSAELWLGLQKDYELDVAVDTSGEAIEREGYTDADLENEINAVMARRDEGVAAAKGQPCPECGARIASGRDMCQYCGHHVAVEPNPLGGL